MLLDSSATTLRARTVAVLVCCVVTVAVLVCCDYNDFFVLIAIHAWSLLDGGMYSKKRTASKPRSPPSGRVYSELKTYSDKLECAAQRGLVGDFVAQTSFSTRCPNVCSKFSIGATPDA